MVSSRLWNLCIESGGAFSVGRGFRSCACTYAVYNAREIPRSSIQVKKWEFWCLYQDISCEYPIFLLAAPVFAKLCAVFRRSVPKMHHSWVRQPLNRLVEKGRRRRCTKGGRNASQTIWKIVNIAVS